jgi:hypothetical protein
MGWLKRLSENIHRLSGEAVRKKVMKDSEQLGANSKTDEMAAWFQVAMTRLDALVEDDVRQRIMMESCPDVPPKTRIQTLGAKYKALGNLDALIQFMHQDTSWRGVSWYEYPVRKGNVVYVKKVAYNPQGCQAATSRGEKRLNYCHCAIARALMRSGKQISPTFCYCGAGWYKRLWEGILEKPIEKIEMLQSVCQGDEVCEFAIHLPIGDAAKL